MDTLSNYRELIQNIIISHTEVSYEDDVELETIFDRCLFKRDRSGLKILGRSLLKFKV